MFKKAGKGGEFARCGGSRLQIAKSLLGVEAASYKLQVLSTPVISSSSPKQLTFGQNVAQTNVNGTSGRLRILSSAAQHGLETSSLCHERGMCDLHITCTSLAHHLHRNTFMARRLKIQDLSMRSERSHDSSYIIFGMHTALLITTALL